VARANGDVALAVEQLELATKLDVGRPSILATLATVARDAGLLEQAEHAYRALLLVVRRRGADEPETPLAAEALYELSRIAVARGDQVQARELIESAVESAVHHAAEARRLERHLLARGEADLLLRITDARLHVAEQPAEKAEILATRARGLAALGKSDEALATWLAAIAEVPSSLEHQRDARAFAATQGRIPAYVEGVSVLLQRRRRREDWAAQADLVSQLATIVEEQGDLRRAAGLYGQLAEHGERVVEAWAAVVRLAGQLADTELQAEALEKLARLSGAAAADLDADALYRVAELQLGRADTGVAGRATLARALQLDPRHDIAADLLWLADVTQPLDEAGFASYEELARQSGNARTLLTFFERRARRPEATLMQDREAVSLAIRLEEGERAEALLVGAVERARGEVGGLAGASWALFSLMERRLAAGDWRSAIAWLREAAKVGEPARVRALGLQLAGTIAHDDPAAAAETYRLLLEQDPADRDVWEPLLTLHQRLGDTVAAKELAERLIAFLVQPADRNRVRMLFVAHLVERVQVDEAIGVLNEVIFDDPDHVDATRQLADLLERAGRCDQLAELLTRQFDYAYERGARDLIVALSLRIGQRVGPEDAAAIYRRALEIAPDDRTVLRALAACIDPARDARARAEVLERLLAAAEPAEAPAIALELADLRTSLGEPAETERALVAGRRAAPEHVGLRDRMEKHYREEEEHAKLAELLVTTAAEIQDAGRAVGMLREAAEIQRDFLLEFGRAAACLAGACRLAPTDAGLIQEYIATLVLAGNRDAAIAEVSRALEVSSWPLDVKVALLRQRAELNRGAGALEATIVDLEAVFALVGAEVAPELVAVLEQRLQALEDAWEHDVERETFARLVAVLEKVGDLERLRTMLEHWTAGRPDDVAALRKLLALETKAERWSGVIQVATQLFRRESGEARVELAIAIADAADRAGQPSAGLTALAELRRTATGDRRVLERLERLYLATESYGRLAELLRDEATRTADAVARAALLVRVGQLHLDAIGDPAAAIEPLEQAAALLPEDLDVTLLLADAFTRAGHHAAARKILEPHVAEQKKRRSPKVPMLLRQMAHLAGATGDSQSQLGWLQEAFDADRKSGLVAAELANLASALQKYDVALKVLRCISLMDDPSPFTRALAFLQQARIALHLGNPGQAELWTKKALRDDPNFTEAQEFLGHLKAAKKGE
jgi:tetratricopeptide (TPR) repeat protein